MFILLFTLIIFVSYYLPWYINNINYTIIRAEVVKISEPLLFPLVPIISTTFVVPFALILVRVKSGFWLQLFVLEIKPYNHTRKIKYTKFQCSKGRREVDSINSFFHQQELIPLPTILIHRFTKLQTFLINANLNRIVTWIATSKM